MIGRDDLAVCRAMLRGGSRSFHAAGLLLPRRVMEPATALYAFCRVADDLIDGGAGGPEVLRERLDRIYAGLPDDYAEDRALAAVVARHRLPRVLLDQLVEGFAWDVAGRQYEDLAELQGYAARVAGTVGAAMAVLMGVRAPGVVARACDLGVAMQLSNIARDVGEDARNGRLYLPRQWLREAGICPDGFLAAPCWTPGLGRVVARLVAAADGLYARADSGIAALPLDCRPGIGAARRLYAAIGHRAVAQGGALLERRAVVPGAVKLGLVARAAVRSVMPGVLPGGGCEAFPLPAVRHLVAAVGACPVGVPVPVLASGLSLGRLVWVIELFASLDARQAMASAERDLA